MKSRTTELGKWELIAAWEIIGKAAKDHRLTIADSAVLWLILDQIGHDGYVEIGFGALSKATGFHRATVVRSIGRLLSLGYIEKDEIGIGDANRYRTKAI